LNSFLIPQAGFINTAPGQMTIRSFQNDIVTQLARVSGGRFGDVLLAPNTLSQALIVASQLQVIEVDGWMQQMVGLLLPQNTMLATIYQITDRQIANAAPIGRAAPGLGFRQIFQ
jgi:hypothetical protein